MIKKETHVIELWAYEAIIEIASSMQHCSAYFVFLNLSFSLREKTILNLRTIMICYLSVNNSHISMKAVGYEYNSAMHKICCNFITGNYDPIDINAIRNLVK